MTHFSARSIPRYTREIAAVLLLKVILLFGLWQFAVKPNKPVIKPDIAELFRPLPSTSTENAHAH